ncbi:heat shock factor protein 5 [Lathamus discolor]|uniref:heat shock factor protein 5 n=1 Tax=Lathamus discolor TaxID=678569 RepID=UPI0032B82CD0
MEGQRLPGAADPSRFPGRLWQLASSPSCGSVRWDARGEGLLIDRRLFERELLGAGPAGGGAALGAGFFKTGNFASFVRQLNLYGFRKLRPGPLQRRPGADAGGSGEPLLHFHNPHFRRDRPDLLVHLKRLTSANKAKLAAGLQVPNRPPQCSQRLPGTALHWDPLLPPSALGGAARPGLVTGGEVPQPGGPESFFGYSDKAALGQNPGTFVTEPFQQTPIPLRTWPGSFGLVPGHWASPAFPGPGAPFPVLHKCPTEVTYTLQTVFSLLPLQRGAPAGAASLPQDSGCASPGQCSQAPDPTAALQRPSPPAQEEPLAVSARAAAAACTDCGFVQSPPAQPPSAAECLPSGGASGEEKVMEELSFEATLEALDKMLSPPDAELVTVEPVGSEMSAPQSVRSQPLLVNSGNSDTPSAAEDSELAPLTPAAPDASFLMEAAQALAAAEGCDGELLFVPYDTASVERAAAAEMALEPVATQEAPEEGRERVDQCPAQLPELFVLEGLFGGEQENTRVQWDAVTEERQLPSGSEAVSKPVEEPGSPVKPGCRKRRHSWDEGAQELGGGACKRGCLAEEDTGMRNV